MSMLLEDICRNLSEGEYYSADMDGGILRVRDIDSQSEYILEEFEPSLQIRQAVCFDCYNFSKDDLSRVYILCSMMNERFSGCKSYIDHYGTLMTTVDLLGPNIEIDRIGTVLNQVEYVSLAMLDLLETQRLENRIITDGEIDSAFNVPPLQ
jgi:hypothetical protein